MNDSYLQILNSILQGESLSHEDLIAKIKNTVCLLYHLSEKEIEELAFDYEKIYGGKTFVPGTTLTGPEANDTWFYKKKKELDACKDHHFQERYERYLGFAHFGKNAILSIISESEKILSFCADPESYERKKGLVMGDVQSGKTSNYLALASLACDYGYKLILILAGMTDSLRIQTQERTDEGFVGAVSSSIGEDTIKYIGVGTYGEQGEYFALPLTTDESDFVKISATSGDFNKPLVLVVKKNKSVLINVKKWLKPGQYGVSSKNIMIIDDECDNASVNTKRDEDSSTINGLIRDIYNNFNCSTYVGYSATPFANIFINPDDDQLGYDDLFPSDFIHRLHASPESYFGADKVFGNLENQSEHLVTLDEEEPLFLPAKHKKDYVYEGLTQSLRTAICNFLICNCIRTHRGDGKKHRSMMVNISAYNIIHEDIKNCIEDYVETLRNTISQYDKYPLERFLKNAEMRRIYDIYTKDPFYTKKSDKYPYKSLNEEVPFSEIKNLLFDEISKFTIAVINNKYKGDQRFKYKEYKDTGARVIAIGGYVLARGLTLEGLMTSYYSRNASAYDTLLQMCRWFGYRPNYEDLCRVYMSQINIDSFDAVIDAVNNLDEQITIMKAEGKAPKDFGLMVKECPDTLETKLLITARNKMKNTTSVTRGLNYSGVSIDTSKLFKDVEKNKKNIKAFRKFYADVLSSGVTLENVKSRKMLRNVKPELIADFIKNLYIPLENKKFDKENLSDFIREKKYYDKWDAVFATGNESSDDQEFEIEPGVKIKSVLRKFEYRDDEDFLRISDHNNRLLEPGIFNAGLSDEQQKEAKTLMKKRIAKSDNPNAKENMISKDYLGVSNRKPLLVILPIYLNCEEDKEKNEEKLKNKKKIRDSFKDACLLGFGIGFAGKNDEKKLMNFRMNKVKADEYLKGFSNEEEEINDD